MTIELIIFVLALIAIIFFFKSFNACVYFIVAVDIFLRLVTYLKGHYLKDSAFSFLNHLPNNVLDIINSMHVGMLNELLVIIYVIIYIIFEVLLIRFFIRRKF